MEGTYAHTQKRVRLSLLTIAAMLALGYVSRYSGTDATLGIALARTGAHYPFFGTLLGWLGVANSSGGVKGKMVDAQSIVVASVAARAHGHEGDILRRVFWHSLARAALVGLLVWLQAYVWPFTRMVGG
jgi:lactate permease